VTARDVARDHRELALADLDPPAIDLRIERPDEDLERIAASIARDGILQPLIVFAINGRYQIVDGYTRYLAAKRAGFTSAPCYVYDSEGAALESAKYATAVYRLELSPAEEATYFHQLFRERCGEDIDAVCALVGRSRGYVDDRLQLIIGDDRIFDAVRRKDIKLGVAKLLNTIPDESWRRHYLRHAISDGATVATVTGWVQEWQTMYGERPASAATSDTASPSAPVAAFQGPVCIVCQKHDPRFIPEMMAVHTHCYYAAL
jgi:ParB family chromosome partitioning protein